MLNPIEKDIFELIFDIDMGANVKKDEKRYLAAKHIAKNQINFIKYHLGITEDEVLEAYVHFKAMKDF